MPRGHAQPGDAVKERPVRLGGVAEPGGPVRVEHHYLVASVGMPRQVDAVNGQRVLGEAGPGPRRPCRAGQGDGHVPGEQAVGAVAAPVVVGGELAAQRRAEPGGRPRRQVLQSAAVGPAGDGDAGQRRHLAPVTDPDREPSVMLQAAQRAHLEQARVQAPAQERQRVRRDIQHPARRAQDHQRAGVRRRWQDRRDRPPARPAAKRQTRAGDQQHRPRARRRLRAGRPRRPRRDGRTSQRSRAGDQARQARRQQAPPHYEGTHHSLLSRIAAASRDSLSLVDNNDSR